MKKLIKNIVLLTIVSLFAGFKTFSQETYYSQDYINKYFAASDEECTFIFEFINQSNKLLKLETYIAETNKLNNQYEPLITSEIIVVGAGQSKTFKINADKLINDCSLGYSCGINCFEKNWHWWQNINKEMKNKRLRIVVKNDSNEGGQNFNLPFKNKNKFEINEISVEYENRTYMSYLITNTTDDYINVFDTRVFYTNNSNNYGRVSNLFTCSCKDLIQERLDKGEFSIITLNEGYKVIALNNDPLDLNNYISQENEDYDFIYEIINNSSNIIYAANILFDDEKLSNVLTLSNDVEIEAGKSYQIKYKLETLKKIYGEKSVLALDVKKVGDTKWIRGWANNFDHKNDKHTIVVSDGTAEQALDVFDLWKDFSNFEKGVLVY